MRVLLIANTLPPRDVSGVGEQVLQLAAGLRREGHEVEVLGRGPGGARGPKVLFPLTIVPATWRALRRLRPDVVQVHESDGGLAALLVVLVRGLFKPRPRLLALLQVSYAEERRAVRPLRDRSASSRGRDPILGRPGGVERRFRRFKAPFQILLGRLSASLADRVLVPSARTAEEIRRDYGVGAVDVLPNVTGGLEVRPEPCPAAVGEGPALLFVGRLRIRKGVEVLLEALARCRPRFPQMHLWIAGNGEHRQALEECTSRLELGQAVTFLGHASAGQVRTLLGRARALVVPSTYEGMPLVILEAMEQAVPVVASAVSGIPEVVVDGATGWLVPPEDVTALENALSALLEDPEEARRRGAAGRERVERLYRPENAARRWLEVVGAERC